MFSRLFRQVGELVGAPGRAEALPAIPLARNSTETVLEDMGRRNDARIPGYEKHTSGWYVGPGHTLLGNDPRLRNGGDWFRDSYGDRFDLDRRLTAAMPWIVLAEGDSNKAVNAKVQLANVRFFFLRGSTREWISAGTSRGVGGDFFFKPELARSTGFRDLSAQCDGSTLVGLPRSDNQLFHGWWTKGRVDIPVPLDDIRAVYVSMQGRLVLADEKAADDLDKARIMMQIGADYYQSRDIGWKGVPVPAIVLSRFKYVTREWQPINALTFNDVGRTDPPGDRGISREEFLRNPPPLD
ncbi:MAG: hypothetical protein GX652_05585 [Burkholderiaceae bacterium]|nr:hypothetical protein [Burkholderiaceae bacterium]